VEGAHPFNGGNGVTVTVTGSVDLVIKAAARHEVLNVLSHQGDLESAFLAYYAEES
jgi:ABC-2 type transport system ATP-binding protein